MVDAHPNLLESVQIPVFVGIPIVSGGYDRSGDRHLRSAFERSGRLQQRADPAIRSRPPNSDCQLVGDCGANYYPKLDVGFVITQVTGVAGGALVGFSYPITINNSGGSLMPWAASVEYLNGAGWLSLDYTSGINNASIRMNADPKSLAAGTYRANVFIDAGSVAGSVRGPGHVRRQPRASRARPPAPEPAAGTVAAGTGGSGSVTGTGTTPPAAAGVTITRIVNAATFDPTPLVAGSLGTVDGHEPRRQERLGDLRRCPRRHAL